MQYDETHRSVGRKWAALSQEYFSDIDKSFREAVNSNKPDPIIGKVYLHDFPYPPTGDDD